MKYKFIEHYNSQRCIGYSADCKKLYFLCRVHYNDNTEDTIVEERQDNRFPVELDKSFVPAICLAQKEE